VDLAGRAAGPGGQRWARCRVHRPWEGRHEKSIGPDMGVRKVGIVSLQRWRTRLRLRCDHLPHGHRQPLRVDGEEIDGARAWLGCILSGAMCWPVGRLSTESQSPSSQGPTRRSFESPCRAESGVGRGDWAVAMKRCAGGLQPVL
jgi:hypothetical protein